MTELIQEIKTGSTDAEIQEAADRWAAQIRATVGTPIEGDVLPGTMNMSQLSHSIPPRTSTLETALVTAQGYPLDDSEPPISGSIISFARHKVSERKAALQKAA